jgi:hypothetical protein
MLDLARETHWRLCWREATGQWTFEPIAESASGAPVTNPQGDDKPVDDDGEIVL